ncbi:MAG: AraC family transcriptional regulator ligand-binding domain-containing protein [Myxococcota bacterium]
MSQLFRIESFWTVILRDLGLSAESLARRAGLPANLFGSDPPMVDLAGWVALWDALEAETGDPDVALHFGQRLTLDMFDPALFAAFCSQDLRQAASRLQLHKRLVGPCRLELSGEADLSLSCRVVGLPLPPRSWGIGELVAWVTLVRHATRRRVVPRRITMPVDLGDPAAYAAFFGVPVTRGSSFGAVLHAADASRPFVTTDASMWSFFEPMLRRRLAELDDRATMAERVSCVLLELLPSGRSGIGDVARVLGTSTRTVQRRLGQEDTRYRDVLDDTRARLARHYLTRSRLTTAEIAFLVGYDDPNSLYPAFRSWTGMSPRAVRASAKTLD